MGRAWRVLPAVRSALVLWTPRLWRGRLHLVQSDGCDTAAPSQPTANCRGRVLPAGPYAAQNNINRNGPFRQSQLGFIIIPAQQTYVAKVGETWIWQGDMWNSYTDAHGRNNKAFDYQVWVPLEFQPDGNISKLAWQDEWSLALA